MAKIECKKCGAEGHSKCPYCRSIFPDNQAEAILSHVLKFEVKRGPIVSQLQVTYGIENEWSEAEALTDLAQLMANMLEKKNGLPSPAEYSCDHQWVFAEGQESDIGCGH